MSRADPTTDVLSGLAVPAIQAPMAGRPSTPASAAEEITRQPGAQARRAVSAAADRLADLHSFHQPPTGDAP
jgi:hypothetical protein